MLRMAGTRFVFLVVLSHTVLCKAILILRKPRANDSNCTFLFTGDEDNFHEGPEVSLSDSIIEFQSGDVFIVRVNGYRGMVSKRENHLKDYEGDGCLMMDAVTCTETGISRNEAASTPCSSRPCVVADRPLEYLRAMTYRVLTNYAGRDSMRILSIGQGIGGLAGWFSRNMPDVEFHSVDKSADVIKTSSCFGLFESPKMRLVAADGNSYVQSQPDHSLSIVFLDAFDFTHDQVPGSLTTPEFLAAVRSKLMPGGVFAMNARLSGLGEQIERPHDQVPGEQRILEAISLEFGPEHVQLLGIHDSGVFGFLAKKPYDGSVEDNVTFVNKKIMEKMHGWEDESFLQHP